MPETLLPPGVGTGRLAKSSGISKGFDGKTSALAFLVSMLRELQNCISGADTQRLRDLIATRVEGYHIQEAEASQAS